MSSYRFIVAGVGEGRYPANHLVLMAFPFRKEERESVLGKCQEQRQKIDATPGVKFSYIVEENLRPDGIYREVK